MGRWLPSFPARWDPHRSEVHLLRTEGLTDKTSDGQFMDVT